MHNYSLKVIFLTGLFVVFFSILSFGYNHPLQETNPENGYYIVVAAYRANQHNE